MFNALKEQLFVSGLNVPNSKVYFLRSQPLKLVVILVNLVEAVGARIIGQTLHQLKALLRIARISSCGKRVPMLCPTKVRSIADISRSALFGSQKLGMLHENRLATRFAHSDEAEAIRSRFDYPPMFYGPDDGDPQPGTGDMLVLKRFDPGKAEKGVLLINYTERIRQFVALYEIERLVNDYVLLLEPSGWGYQDPTFLMYLGKDADVVIQAPRQEDYMFVKGLHSNIEPVRIGAGDWVDPSLFKPQQQEPEYDIVMVAAWSPVKRHHELFNTLKSIRKQQGRRLQALLIGHEDRWDKSAIARLAGRYGVRQQVKIVQSLSYEQMPEAISSGKVHVLTSRSEGANRATYEAMFCDTPVIVPADHCGIRLSDIVPPVGLQFSTGNLLGAILRVLDNQARYEPRRWAMKNTGYMNSTKQLNEKLISMAAERGLNWSHGIVAKSNRFNASYVHQQDAERMAPEYERLQQFVR